MPSTSSVFPSRRGRRRDAVDLPGDPSGENAADRTVDRTVDRDRGNTLIEIVLAIVLTAVLVVPLLSAVSTGIAASRINEGAANAETAIVDAADRVNRAPQTCDYTQYVVASVLTKGWAASTASAVTQAYDPVAGNWKPAGPGSGCLLASPTESLVQLVTITITTPKGDVTRNIQVVKSNV